MSTLAALAALPAALLAVWVLLRSPRRRAGSSRRPTATAGTRAPTPLVRRHRHLPRPQRRRSGSPCALGALRPTSELLGIYAGIDPPLPRGPRRRRPHAAPAREARSAVRRGRDRARDRHARRARRTRPGWRSRSALLWLVGMTNAFNLLDNMDGLAATLAAIAFGVLRVDAATVHPDHRVLVLALARAPRVCGLPAVQPAPGRAPRSSSWATAARRCSASRSPRSASRRAGRSPTSTVATLLLPMLVLAVPILDTTLVTVVRLLDGRPVYQGGRDHSSHRLVRFGALREERGVLLALVAAALGGDEPRLQRARQRPASRARRRARHVRRCSCSSRASSPTSSGAPPPDEPPGCCRRSTSTGAASSRSSSTSR